MANDEAEPAAYRNSSHGQLLDTSISMAISARRIADALERIASALEKRSHKIAVDDWLGARSPGDNGI